MRVVPPHWAALTGHTAVAELLLTRGANKEAQDSDGFTPLHWAALKGHKATAKLLLERDAPIEVKDVDGWTPLHWAAQKGHTAIVELLLDAKADIEAKDRWNYTPLHWAALKGHKATAKLLLERDAPIEAKDVDGWTPLHRAALKGHTAIVELLLKAKADIEAKDNNGRTPLHRAALQGHTDTVELLLKHGVSIESKNKEGETALHQAVIGNRATLVELLLKHGASIKSKNRKGLTPLHQAVIDNRATLVELLLKHGAAVATKDNLYDTPLHWAAQKAHMAIIKLLLARGATIDTPNRWGYTPLHRAVIKNHIAAVELLLANGADSSIQDSHKKTALDIAIEQDHEEVATLLRAAQAPGWKPRSHTSAVPSVVIENVTDSASKKDANDAQRVKPATQPSVGTTPPTNVKDAPALAQAKEALQAALDTHTAAQKSAEAAARALQEEAQTATDKAKHLSQASLTYLQTMQQHGARLADAPPAPRCVAPYLQDTVKEAQDYLHAWAEANEVVSEDQKQQGNRLLAVLDARRQQEQQHYRHADQLFLYDTTLSEYAQAQLLGEVLPQHQYHIDTLSHLIGKLTESGHEAPQAPDQKPDLRTPAQLPVVVEDVTDAEEEEDTNEATATPPSAGSTPPAHVNEAPALAQAKVELRSAFDKHKTAQEKHANSPINHKGLPNVGNTCYLNAGLQVIARLYPNLFSDTQDNTIARDGKTIIEKLTHHDRTEEVAATEAEVFRDHLIQSYNRGKKTHDQLQKYQQEDAAPVFNFLLEQAQAKELALYHTKVHPQDKYPTTTNPKPSPGTALVLTAEPAPMPMDQLVAKTLCGKRATDVIWEQGEQEVRDEAVMGDQLSIDNLHNLNNRILPIWVHRFGQTDNTDADTAEKVTASITNPFSLTIPAEHLIENVPYTGKLVGFIHHAGEGLHSGHYTAYVQHSSGAWVCYNDAIVTTLDTPPTQEAQTAYLYFYQAVDSIHEEVPTKEVVSRDVRPQPQDPIDTLSHLIGKLADTGHAAPQTPDQKPDLRTPAQLPVVVEDVTDAEEDEDEHGQSQSETSSVYDSALEEASTAATEQVAEAITVPFDNRPLAPLTRAVDRICTQLKKGDLDTEQLDNSLRKGQKLMLEIAQQPYNASLDWQERIQYKTLADKLSCHVRLYQCLHTWAQDFTDADRQAFDAVILPVLKQQFLRANTTVQQEMLTYWENGGHCYADLLQDAAVEDWLKVSLHHDIVLAGLVNDDTLLQERFMQEVERLVQHREGPTQQKLLTQLLWSLRARQQANQLDLLTLCEVTEWLPTDGRQSLHLLNNEAPDWYPAIKANWLRSRLATFADRYAPEAITKLCALLVRLPWNKALTDSFLHAAAAEPDPIAFEHFLHFLEKYPLEDNLLLDTFYTALPEEVASPCKRWHHTLVCGLLREPLTKLFDGQADTLHQQIAAWLPPRLGAYDALHALLATLQTAEATQQVRAVQALQLQKVFALLSDYGAAAEACTDTFQSIAHQPASQWEATTHQLVVDATFHASHELSTQEIIDRIAQNAQGVFFVGDAQQLQHSYDAIMTTYQGPSQVLQQASPKEDGKEGEDEETTQHNAEAQQPIAHWSQETITRWARLVKSQQIPVTQNELLAVVKRAVALHHGFAPRTTQLLSVLTLLSTPEKMGRLAQINTGEGKSLIVAMLAAVHALKGQKVDVVTTSAELSIPEIKKQAPFFTMLGLTAAENSKKNAVDDEARHAIYQKDIVYGTAEDFQADIIQTEFFRKNIRGNRGFGVVLVDEVDSMLFDDRSYSTQLSSLTPAMNHLEVVLGTIWCQINLIASHLRTIDGQDYVMLTDQFKDLPDGGIILPEGTTLAKCSRPVDDRLGFLKEKTIGHLETVLRKLTPEDRKNLAAYKAQEQRVQDLSKKVQQDEKKHKEKQEDLEKEHKEEQEHLDRLYTSLHCGNAMYRRLCRAAESIVLREKRKQHFLCMLDSSDRAALEEVFNVRRKKALDTLKKNHKEALDTLKKRHQEQEAASKATLQAAVEALEKEPWHQEAQYLEIPVHLQDFARTQISNWVESAITALLRYKKNEHYYVKGGKILVIDYGNTGVLQYNTVLEKGLTQFLQIKEGLKVSPEGVSTNSISKPGYFKRYGSRLYGLTGTLGNATTRSFLTDMYGIDMVTIPPYKHREISGNENSRYLCKELLPTLETTPEAWYDAIIESVLRPARHGQAVLVICNYMNQVHHLKERLAAKYNANKVFVYTGEEDFEKHQVDMGEIILGTNIAGRGTDLTTSAAVENHGGLHVCITFLPPSYRVELQNAGRTARQGKKGTAQLILRTSSEETLQTLRAKRDERENSAIERARRDVENRLTADRLFMRYCGAEASFFPTMEAVAKMKLSQDLLTRWQVNVEVSLSDEIVQALYEEEIQHYVQKIQEEEPDSWKDYTAEALAEARKKQREDSQATYKAEHPLETFREQYEKKHREAFLMQAKTQKNIPDDVLMAFLDNQVYVPPGSDLVKKYGWTEAERHGGQERWGLWLKEDSTEKDTGSEARHRRFDGLERELKSDAQADKLIKNPSYYVEKGNELRRSGLYRLAAKAFDRAIDLDPPYSSIARFNKAMALVSSTSNKCNQSEAKHELEKAKDLIETHDKNALLAFDTLVGQTGKKPRTSEHVQHQLDILSQLENYILNAISVIEGAQEEDLDVEISEIQSLQEVFKDAEGDRSQAFREAAANGLTHVFTIKEVPPPTPWWSIIAVALIGLAQITAGVFLSVCTLGTGLTFAKGLISEGVSDLITAVKSGIQGSFSWAEWALQKTISLAVSLISAGWDAIKKGCTAIKETAQNVGRTAAELGKKGIKAAWQRVGAELGKGIAKECANALVNYGVDELLIKNIEKKIEKDVTEKIMHYLAQSTLVKAALALDVKNNSNYWQNLLQQEGMALLATTKDNKVLYALKEIAKGVAGNKIKGADAVLKGAAMAKAMAEVLTFTDKFLGDFHRKLEQTYKDKIKTAETAQEKIEQQQAAQQQENEQQQTHQQVVSAPTLPTDEEDIAMPVITIQEDYKSDLRDYYYEKPSSNQGLCHKLSRTITSSMTQKIQGEVIRPATGALVNWGIDKMLENVEKAVQKSEEDFCIEGKQYYHTNKVGNESLKEREGCEKQKAGHDQQDSALEDKASSSNKPAQTAEEVNRATKPTSAENEAMAQKVRAGTEAGIAELGAAAAELRKPIAVYDEHGRLLEILGRGHKGALAKIQHLPSADGLSGHYVPYGTKATAGFSGASNCAYDAIACQTDKVSSGAELREKVANRLATSAHTPALYHATKQLAIYNPRAMRRGGHCMDTTFYDPIVIEKLWNNKKRDEGNHVDYQTFFTDCQKSFLDAQTDGLKTLSMVGAGWAVSTLTAGTGVPAFLAYSAGAGTVSGLGIALDAEIHADIKAGDWSGALNHSSYHLPFVGTGRNSWDAWKAGHPWYAAGHASLFGVEAFGLRGVGKLQGAGRVRGSGRVTKPNAGITSSIRITKARFGHSFARHGEDSTTYLVVP
jgi:ankyrin repeat protein